jgi:hypothetical protein
MRGRRAAEAGAARPISVERPQRRADAAKSSQFDNTVPIVHQ